MPEIAWRFQFRSGNRVPRHANERLHDLWTHAVGHDEEDRG